MPNRYVLSAIICHEEALPSAERLNEAELATLTLADYLTWRALAVSSLEAPEAQPADSRHEVLIFDQFEEILTQDPTDKEAKDEFFKQVGQALQARHRWALFVLREDFLGALEPFSGAVPTRLSNAYRLDLLQDKAAREAIQMPAKASGVIFSEDAANLLIENLSRVQVQGLDGSMTTVPGSYIEPVQLQVVCHLLWQKLANDASEVTPEDIRRVGDVDQALAKFYAEQVAVIAKKSGLSERAIREWFHRELITPQGIRGQVMRAPDDTRTNITDEAENAALDDLVNSHLVRAEKRRGVTWYELAHDRLIKPVRDDNEEWFKENLVPSQRQALLWQDKGQDKRLLLGEKEWKTARQWALTHPQEVTPVEKKFFEACRFEFYTRRRIRAMSLSLVCFLLLFAFSRFKQTQRIATLRLQGLYQQLAAQSQVERPKNAELGLLLALEALNFGRLAEKPRSRWLMTGPESTDGIFVGQSALLASLSQSPQLITILSGPAERLEQVALSRDGDFVAAADEVGYIWLWDAKRKKPPLMFGDKGNPVRSLAV